MGRRDNPVSAENSAALVMGARLRQVRQEKGISLTEMADRLGYTKGYLSGVENDKEKVSKELMQGYERELELKPGDLSELLRVQGIVGPLSFTSVITFLVKSAPYWLNVLTTTLLKIDQNARIKKSIKDEPVLLSLSKEEQLFHMELVLKNAAERGLAKCNTREMRERYRDVLIILSELSAGGELLRSETMHLIVSLPRLDAKELNEVYSRSLHVRTPSQPILTKDVDAAPYLSSFFEALIAELHTDPLFRGLVVPVLNFHNNLNSPRSWTEVVSTLAKISNFVADNYTVGQFERDVVVYKTHMERTLHFLKLIGIVPKDRGDKNVDPELMNIFVPLRIAFQDQNSSTDVDPYSMRTLLEQYPYVVLLGGPGSGKTTVLRYLAWSHAAVKQTGASQSKVPLLPGNPLPLRIELRHLMQERRLHPDYDFLTYVHKVLLAREGVVINPEMFKVLLERRAMLLLFDGLDEVATLDERERLIEEIEHFVQYYPGNRIVITSRPIGYELSRFSTQWFLQARVQEFDDEQILQFLEQWYRHVLRLSPMPYEDQQELKALFTTLKENTRLHKLAVVPLLLTVITALHRYERLPDRRILVYDRCADLLIETWAKLKGTDSRWLNMKMGKEDQFACVAHLGFVLHKRSQKQEGNDEGVIKDTASDVSTRFMLREIEHFLSSRKLIKEAAEQRTEAKRFLELMQVEAGLIVERGTDQGGELLYGFVHRSFQEYFAASDVYERYLEEEDPTIIRAFLNEHLHDPHWREVIFLLLGKLRRKPVTILLNHIIEGKMKSLRSQYTDLIQQDLFFVCDCLIEEIGVENELVDIVVTHLIDVVKKSVFPTQRKYAIRYLALLAQTRQYSSIGHEGLLALTVEDRTLNVYTIILIIQTLYRSAATPKERAWAIQCLLSLAQRPGVSVEGILRIASILYSLSPDKSEEQQKAIQILLDIAQRPDLTFKEIMQVSQALYSGSHQPSKEREYVTQKLLLLTQQANLSIEQVVKASQALHMYSFSGSEEQEYVTQRLLSLAQRSDLSVEQTIHLAQVLNQLNHVSSEGKRPGTQIPQMLSNLEQRPDLPVEQRIQVAQALYQLSARESEEQRFAVRLLLNLTQRSDLLVEESIQVAQALYKLSAKESEEQRFAVRLLLNLTQRSDLLVEESIQIAQALYQCSPIGTKERRLPSESLMKVVMRPDLLVEERIQVAQALYQCSPRGSEERRFAAKLLVKLARLSDLPVEQSIQVAQALYQCSPTRAGGRLAAKLLMRLIRDQSFTVDQRLKAIKEILEKEMTRYSERVQAIQVLLSLIAREAVIQYIEKHWQPVDARIKLGLADIPYIIELAQQEVLPIEVRDEMYQILYRMVPLFGSLFLSMILDC